MLRFNEVREMGFYRDGLSRDWIMILSVFLDCCQGICAARGGNIPAAISDTHSLSATKGTHDMMIGVISARPTDGKIATGGDMYFAPIVMGSVCVYMCVCGFVGV